MKRKIFSKLLMGAFLIASVSSFVSCKDYDDDINNLQKQIDAAALKADLNALQTSLQAQIAAAQSAADKAAAAAAAAQKTADNAATKEALESVKTIATNAGTAAAQAIADAANAKAAADAAQTTANNAGTAAEKAAADAAKAIADAAAAQNTANVATTAAAAAQKAAEVAQSAADGANTNATKALADAATALANAAAAQDAAKAAQGTADAATAAAATGNDAAAKAQATAETAVAAAAAAATQAAEALAAAQAAQVAAAEATNSNEAIRGLLDKANKYADDAAQAAKDAAVAALAASEAAAAAQDEAADAKKAVAEATEAITKATDAKIAAAVAEVEAKLDEAVKAQATADAAQDAAQAEAIAELEAELKTMATTESVKAIAEGLEASIQELSDKLDETADAAAVAAVAAAAGTIKDAFDVLYSAVSSVELVASFSASDYDEDIVSFPFGVGAAGTPGVSTNYGVDLNFYFGKQKFTSKFGDKETESLDDDADEIITYTEGADIRTKMALLVRVNPANATFTKDQVKLVNTKLETLDGIVEILEPKRFTGIITRGQENGLWVIPVKVVDGTTFNQFNEKTFFKSTPWAADDYLKDGEHKGDLDIGGANLTYNYPQKLYAVAINNTDDPESEDASRYVTSTYDIAAAYKHYTPAVDLDAEFAFVKKNKMDEADLDDIHNRWAEAKYLAENGEKGDGIKSKDQSVAYTMLNPEKSWAHADNQFATQYAKNSPEYTANMRIPAPYAQVATIGGNDKWNTQDANKAPYDDRRFSKPFLNIEKIGDNIKVSLPHPYYTQRVEYWYISYDFENNAVESKPSEWEAWQSYQDGIEGLYKMARGSQSIDLKINKSTADGDVIGFRVWAVNYDGSLCDPDGKAFYVKIGEGSKPKENIAGATFFGINIEKNLTNIANLNTANYTVEKEFNVSKEPADISDKTKDFESLVLEENNGVETVAADEIINGTVKVYWKLLNAKKAPATNWNDIHYLVVGVDGSDLQKIVNDQAFTIKTLTGVRKDANNQETYTLTLQATKVTPDLAWVKKNYYDGIFTWHKDYDPVSETMTIYPKPYKKVEPVMMLNPQDIDPADDKVKFVWRAESATTAQYLWDSYDDATYLDWVNTPYIANAGVRKIEDYNYKPTHDSDLTEDDLAHYFFKFAGLPTGLTNPAKADFISYWTDTNKPTEFDNHTFVTVLPAAIRNNYAASLNYEFEKVVTKYDNGFKVENYNPAVWEFTASFKDALDLVEYTGEYNLFSYTEWQQGNFGLITKKGDVTVTGNTLYIPWLGGTTLTPALTGATNFSTSPASTTASYALVMYQPTPANYTFAAGGINPETGVAWDVTSAEDKQVSQAWTPSQFELDYSTNAAAAGVTDLTAFLKAKISSNDYVLSTGVQNAGVWTGAGLQIADGAAFNPNYYAFAADNPNTTIDETGMLTISLTGNITTYLRIDPTSTPNAIKVFKVGGIADPHVNIDGNLVISGVDVFGKSHTVATIPVEIVHNF